MSFFRGQDPEHGNARQSDAIARVIVPRTADLGEFSVRRALPSAQSRMVGPFIFFDHMGPAEFTAGRGIDVRPHPHIGLATVTYLFDGEIMHRDSLGTIAPIRPGEVNWMTAGRGIAHSERTAPERRQGGERVHGLQCWVALPSNQEERDPGFVHHPASDFPVLTDTDKRVRVVAGTMYGERSPLIAASDTLFVDASLSAGAKLPVDASYEERAIYIVDGEIEIAGDRFAAGRLLVVRPGDILTINAITAAHVVLIGGAPMDGPRHIWWNFVSSSRDRIEAAKADWRAGRFSLVPGETEFIPLPEQIAPPQVM